MELDGVVPRETKTYARKTEYAGETICDWHGCFVTSESSTNRQQPISNGTTLVGQGMYRTRPCSVVNPMPFDNFIVALAMSAHQQPLASKRFPNNAA